MTSIPSPDSISESAFAEALARYPSVIKTVSEAKSAKPGQQTLEELDAVRYVVAPRRFGLAGGAATRAAMSLDDVKTLVAWKLKHGKFRPTLMKLVESNDKAAVETTIKAALAAYEAALSTAGKGSGAVESHAHAHAHAATVAVGILSRLRGIGPATASLLAAVHYPQTTIFFSDEAYAWLCGGSGAGYQKPSKYNDKEYAALARSAAALMARLGKTAQDVEQVAYVLINGGGGSSADEKAQSSAPKTKAKAKAQAQTQAKAQKDPGKSTAKPKDNKRKEAPTDAALAGSRRSSRLRSG